MICTVKSKEQRAKSKEERRMSKEGNGIFNHPADS
jgi:hypothetical protein